MESYCLEEGGCGSTRTYGDVCLFFNGCRSSQKIHVYIYIFGIFTETWKVKTGQSLKTNVGKETFPIWILWVFSSFPICPPLIWLKYPRNMVNDKIQLWNNGPGIVKRKFIDKPYHLDTAQVGIDSGNIGNCQLKHKGSDQNPKFKAMVQGSWWITNPNKAQVWFPQHGSHCIIHFTREPLCSKKKNTKRTKLVVATV